MAWKALSLALMLACAPAQAAEIATDGDTLAFVGVVVPGDEIRLEEAVAASLAKGTAIKALLLNSPGGDVEAGWLVAQAVRRHGIATVLTQSAKCQSICALIFAAGLTRFMSAWARLEVHSASSGRYATDLVAGELRRYGCPEFVIKRLKATPYAGTLAPIAAKELGKFVRILE